MDCSVESNIFYIKLKVVPNSDRVSSRDDTYNIVPNMVKTSWFSYRIALYVQQLIITLKTFSNTEINVQSWSAGDSLCT